MSCGYVMQALRFVLVNLAIIACTAVLIQGKAFPDKPEPYYGGNVYSNRYWDPNTRFGNPHSLKKVGQNNRYYTPIIDERPIYVPPPGYSTKEINKILEEYYGSKELSNYDETEMPEDLLNYNHPVWNNMARFPKTTENIDNSYESQTPLKDPFQRAYDQKYHYKDQYHHGDYHMIQPGHDQLKYQQNINENLESDNSYERPNIVHNKKIPKYNFGKIKNIENLDINNPFVEIPTTHTYDGHKIVYSSKLKHKLKMEAPTKLDENYERSTTPEDSDKEQDIYGGKNHEDYDIPGVLHNVGRTKHGQEKHGTKKTKRPIKNNDTKVDSTAKESNVKDRTKKPAKEEKSTIRPHVKVEANNKYYKSYLIKDRENYLKEPISSESRDEHEIPKTNVMSKHGDKINKKEQSNKCPSGKTEHNCFITENISDSKMKSKDVPSEIQYESFNPSGFYETPEVVYVNKVGEINIDHLDKIKNPDVNDEIYIEEKTSTNAYEKPKVVNSVKVKGTIKNKPYKTVSTKAPKRSKGTNKIHASDKEWSEIKNESPQLLDSYEAPKIAYVNKIGEMSVDHLDEIKNTDAKSEAPMGETPSTNAYDEPEIVYSIKVKSAIKNKPNIKTESTKAPTSTKSKTKIPSSYTELNEILSETDASPQPPDTYEAPKVVYVKKSEVENDKLENTKDPHIKKETHLEKTPTKNAHEVPKIEGSTKVKENVKKKPLTKPKFPGHSMLKNENSLDVANFELERVEPIGDLKSLEKLDGIPDSEVEETKANIIESPNTFFGAETEPFENLGSGAITDDYEDPSPQFLDADNGRSLPSLNANLFSLIFNPNAQKHELIKCITKTNETGICMYISDCQIPNIATTLEQLLNNACVMDEVFIGVCCPEFPVETVQVDWEEVQPGSSEKKLNDELGHEDCGRKSRDESKAIYWPWKASLISMANGKIFCGGVVIRNNYILTAAHCTTKISKNQILIRLGQNKESPGEDFAVIEIKRHAQYNSRTLNNDIALLKLARHVPFDENINAVCIPDVDDNDHVDEKGILLGWQGVSKENFDTELLKIMSNKKCGEKLRRNIPESMLCTEERDIDERTCNADSGAALVVEDDDKYEVVGVLSWNRNDCDPRFPSIFSRVPSYVRWIQKHAV